MKNTMKKLLALILVAIMFVTIVPMAYAEGNIYIVGDVVQFGSYPQSEVKDEALITELNALTPEWEDWTSYGYYSGNGNYGSMVQGDWMRYVDIICEGFKYRGVRFTRYRQYCTYYSSADNATEQDDNGYISNTVYWFKFEPIDWLVLDPAKGLVICETIIDSQPYSNAIYFNNDASDSKCAYFNDVLYLNYACDYETSSIRQWLNNDFYNTAFTDSEKKEIGITALNNDCFWTLSGYEDYEEFDSNPTNDKIFLLSYEEVEKIDSSNKLRKAQRSDYALSQGLDVRRYTVNEIRCESEYSSWLLRTSDGNYSYLCLACDEYGSVLSYSSYFSNSGVRPALRFIDLKNYKHTHDYNSFVTPPTCTRQGFTTYICGCNGGYVTDYVDAKGHIDSNGDYKCDYDCGYEFEKPEAEEPKEELNFFQKIIQWFKDLFAKLFGWLK